MLEKDIDLIHERISRTCDEINQKFQKMNKALKIEEKSRKKKDSEICSELKKARKRSAIGVSCLFVGVIFSTIPDEVAGWIQMISTNSVWQIY